MNRAYSRAGIIARLFNQPLAVLPETAAIVLGAIGQRFDVQNLFVATDGRSLNLGELEQLAADKRVEIEARGGVDRQARMVPADRLMFVHNGVAHVGVRGETVAENGIGPMSGFTGYDGIVASVQSADADPNVRGILLDIDSPGGEVAGLFEACSILMARRGTKPMRAMIRGVGASAAYQIAACADEVTLHELGLAGSNGCISMHADFSAALQQDGIKVTLFASGAHKADGNPFEPLPEDVANMIRARIESSAERLFAHVAAARGLTVETVRAQQAQIYTGEEAVAAGLVDKVMGWQDSMDEFEAAVNAPTARTGGGAMAPTGARSSKGSAMSNGTTAPAAEQQPENTQATLEAARTEGHAAGRAEGLQAGTTAERERVSALVELDAASTVSPALAAAIASGASAGDFAIDLAKASKAKLGAALSAAKTEAVTELPEGSASAGIPGASGKTNRGQAYAEKKAASAKA
ncbi:S49 family peptidase [Novosphingobium mangrovi (ex Huang et al. 2023)]|uniref:S49 family peptidase n=1 Tax=Novosphingobium mangrovi (ex Huang et al. 2023) TaxID=2976432 RepID=A0ABT2I149_9SPHN|nr:S49 family peptidase [Novosphingobium mangrovi (ex Huang et al. 2023)]MCT2398520.1 S49 family peptidase [Novosphingobium mangrovi (ex Huang et al. 2023)]